LQALSSGTAPAVTGNLVQAVFQVFINYWRNAYADFSCNHFDTC
jgi:hypothetical protein